MWPGQQPGLVCRQGAPWSSQAGVEGLPGDGSAMRTAQVAVKGGASQHESSQAGGQCRGSWAGCLPSVPGSRGTASSASKLQVSVCVCVCTRVHVCMSLCALCLCVLAGGSLQGSSHRKGHVWFSGQKVGWGQGGAGLAPRPLSELSLPWPVPPNHGQWAVRACVVPACVDSGRGAAR